MKQVIIFGADGMLGRYVKETLQTTDKVSVICSTRKDFDIEKGSHKTLRDYLFSIFDNSCTGEYIDNIVINCAGAIPQKYGGVENSRYYIQLNTLFPLWLYDVCSEYNNLAGSDAAKLIHITTDCVFSGAIGKYNENDIHDETGIYGITKSLGEPKPKSISIGDRVCVLRTSIIGEELYSKKSLLEWVLSNRDQTINGYTSHYWNGVTCLTLSKIIRDIIISDDSYFPNGTIHVHSPDVVSKYDLCKYINEIYDLGMTITPYSSRNVDKTLTTIYENNFNIDCIKDQIQELFDYHHSRSHSHP